MVKNKPVLDILQKNRNEISSNDQNYVLSLVVVVLLKNHHRDLIRCNGVGCEIERLGHLGLADMQSRKRVVFWRHDASFR